MDHLNIESLHKNILLSSYTTWKIGGKASFFVEPSLKTIAQCVTWARAEKFPIYFLGCGSNVLIDDAGLQGLVISTRNSITHLYQEGDFLVAGSGVFLPKLSRFAARQGFSGFEFLIGIPGTVGGAIVMNAGLTVFSPREMVDIVEDFDVLNPDGKVERLTMRNIHAGYRQTDLLDGDRCVLQARLRLENAANPDEIRRHTFEHLAERKRKQPLDKPTAGSTFRSPRGEGRKSAGWYIEQVGLKGFQIGQARVSPVHANWIENLGGATAADVRKLIEYIQKSVATHHGVILEPEVRFLT